PGNRTAANNAIGIGPRDLHFISSISYQTNDTGPGLKSICGIVHAIDARTAVDNRWISIMPNQISALSEPNTSSSISIGIPGKPSANAYCLKSGREAYISCDERSATDATRIDDDSYVVAGG